MHGFNFFFFIILQVSRPFYSFDLLYQHTSVLERQCCITGVGSGDLGNMIHTNTVCTNNQKGNGICTGDMGGPLITRNGNVLVGLASWHTSCGDERPDVYTRVFSHLKFIREVMVTNPIQL